MADVNCPTCTAPAAITGQDADKNLQYKYIPPVDNSYKWWNDKAFWAAILAVAATISSWFGIDSKVAKKAEAIERVEQSTKDLVEKADENHKAIKDTKVEVEKVGSKVGTKKAP